FKFNDQKTATGCRLSYIWTFFFLVCSSPTSTLVFFSVFFCLLLYLLFYLLSIPACMLHLAPPTLILHFASHLTSRRAKSAIQHPCISSLDSSSSDSLQMTTPIVPVILPFPSQ